MLRLYTNKSNKINIPELLAPAGNYDSFIAAVQAGANAVYIGGKNFSARNYAQNFTIEEIEEIVSYARARNVKVYVTVNTLISQDELARCLEYIGHLISFNIDALIIQDMGLIHLLKKEFPYLPLHGSTQMTIHNNEGAKLCADLGMDRVILAREMTFNEINEVSKKSPIGIEVFVHGAMCYSYSGRCLFSSLIGGRSGNRGCCSQPCRMEYALLKKEKDQEENGDTKINAPGNYLISYKDLCLIKHLGDLVEAGVAALKIEGRMKSPEYVGIVTHTYRKNLDRIKKGSWSGPSKDEIRDLKQIFNRQFTSGYFNDHDGKGIIAYNTPNNRGLYIGRIKRVTGDEVCIGLTQKLSKGDKIQIWTSKGRVPRIIDTMQVDDMEVDEAGKDEAVFIKLTEYASPGDRVFKVYDRILMEKALSFYKSPKEQLQIPVKAIFTARRGEPGSLKLIDPGGQKVTVQSSKICEKPEKHALTERQVKGFIDRLGNTPFILDEFIFDCNEEVMLPYSVINELRRQAISKLINSRAKANSPKAGTAAVDNKVEFACKDRVNHTGADEVKLVVSVKDLESMESAIKGGAHGIYLETVEKDLLIKAANMANKEGLELAIRLPSIVIPAQRRRINQIINEGIDQGISHYVPGEAGTVWYLKERGLPFVCDYQLNIFNASTCHIMEKFGAVRVTLSPELNLSRIKETVCRSPIPCEAIVYGYLPLITTRQNMIASLENIHKHNGAQPTSGGGDFYLKDRKNVLFPVKARKVWYTEILNGVPLVFLEHIDVLINYSVKVLRIETAHCAPAKIERITRVYASEVRKYLQAPEQYSTTKEAMSFMENEFSGLYTKGHYFRSL